MRRCNYSAPCFSFFKNEIFQRIWFLITIGCASLRRHRRLFYRLQIGCEKPRGDTSTYDVRVRTLSRQKSVLSSDAATSSKKIKSKVTSFLIIKTKPRENQNEKIFQK